MVLIGVAPGWDEQAGKLTVHRDYTDAVLRAGALPVLLPLTDGESVLRSMLDRVDGVLFTGGGDVSPARYGEAALPCCGEICPARDDFEFALLAQALAMDRPILAVCRGLQVLNTALGGTLYQDIGKQMPGALIHPRNDQPRDGVHAVTVEKDSLLGKAVAAARLEVNSRHHQGIRTLGAGLRPTTRAADGLIEAVEMPAKRFVLAVQWHPESMSGRYPEQQAIFNAFTEACGG